MRRWIVRVLVAVAVLLVGLGVYGVLVEPRLILDEDRLEVTLPRLDERWAGTEVALLSDLQVGMWWANTGMVERAVRRAVEAEPDVVLLGGDFLYSSSPSIAEQVDTVLELLDPLVDAGIPTFAVLGNHDLAVGAADELTAMLEGAGIPVLTNESAPVPGGSGPGGLYVVGVGPALRDVADAEEALGEVPDGAARVVLAHNPTVFPDLPAGSAPLALAGHTHCGQVVIPGVPFSYVGLTEEEARVAEGWAPEGYGEPGNRLFVTCGLGFSHLPVRINAPPELVLVELRPAGG
ncbi:metallophosphoesterase [Geodermatophilus sp. DF01-2]|uniref:metallophosphoesterase n=1 Tax=Geodermatophilus sp. DF01-2 TaxID=2559610 RepID=UPI0010731520|nr:metallophosphoesterase [Geodermatophilus sp. DF01_2]TFV56652.1 metallophosphoesterase [Geodermatophilus sp. DF01_2]